MSNTLKVCYVATIQDAEEIINDHEESTTSKFVCAKQNKIFGKDIDPIHLNARILWEDISNEKATGHRLKFDGSPFMIAGRKVLDCHHGVDRHISGKAKYRARRDSEEPAYKRSRHATKDTKKLNCPAKIRIREILKFHKYKIADNSKTNRLKAAKNLREDLKSRERVNFERRIYVELPEESCHRNHVTGEASGQSLPLDKALVKFIHEQVYKGVNSVGLIRLRVTDFVENRMFLVRDPPPRTNRRFHPTDQDIRNHMYLARLKSRLISGDQHKHTSHVNTIALQSAQKQTTPLTCILSVNPMNVENGVLHDVSETLQSVVKGKALGDICTKPVTIHLQVEPEQTKQMAINCQKLLRTLHNQACRIQDPHILYQLHSSLLSLSNAVDKMSASTEHSEQKLPDTRPKPDASLLEREILKNGCSSDISRKKNHLLLGHSNDSDFEVYCETQSIVEEEEDLQIPVTEVVS